MRFSGREPIKGRFGPSVKSRDGRGESSGELSYDPRGGFNAMDNRAKKAPAVTEALNEALALEKAAYSLVAIYPDPTPGEDALLATMTDSIALVRGALNK